MDDRLALSTLDWWEEAGVDTLVDDLPRDWLAAAAAKTLAVEPLAAAQPVTALPNDLAALRAWLLESADVPGPRGGRIDACGDPASGTMIVLDMPEPDDRTTKRLLSDETGDLLDRMLAAMGISRETSYLVPFSPARPASGRLDPAVIATLSPIVAHHIALAAPKRLLVMGEAPTRALLGISVQEARGRAHAAPVPTIATFPPRFILQATGQVRKDRRALIWDDLQRFMAL